MQQHDTAADDADDAQTETEALEHPLEIGSVFTTAGGRVVKVIADRKQTGPDMWLYTGVTYNGTRRRVNSFSHWDMNANVSEHGWELDVVPSEVSEE